MKEIWKEVDGFPHYHVSNLGRVKSLERRTHTMRNGKPYSRLTRECVLKTFVATSGYLAVSLYGSGPGSQQQVTVHTMVADAFIPNPDGLPFVLHNDGNPLNCHVRNLRWGTSADNSQDCIAHGRMSRGTHRPAAKLTDEDIPEIRKLARSGLSQRNIGRLFDISQTTVWKIVNRDLWTHIK